MNYIHDWQTMYALFVMSVGVIAVVGGAVTAAYIAWQDYRDRRDRFIPYADERCGRITPDFSDRKGGV